MKKLLFIALVCLSFSGFSQEVDELPGLKNLSNVVVVGQLDKLEDRYSVEINLTQLFQNYGIKTSSSLNIVKQGGDIAVLATDSLQKQLQEKGFDTYMLVSVRGYDKRFKKSTSVGDFKSELAVGHLFPLFREDIVSVTFEVIIYQSGKAVENRLIKVGSIGSREAVMKKLVKKLSKQIRKNWKNS
ncbi:MAG: hypothetical protein ACPGU5_00080 [Lishizhenia sp.]